MAFEGYDTILALAEVLRGVSWADVDIEGTRGRVTFSCPPGSVVWQWAWAPVQVVDRDPAAPERFRTLG